MSLSPYWRYQLAGWLGLLVFDYSMKLLSHQFNAEQATGVAILYSLGLVLSHGLRSLYKRGFRQLAIWVTVPAAIIYSLVAAALASGGMMLLLYLTDHSVYQRPEVNPLELYFYNVFAMWLFFLIWTGLYLFITRQRQVETLHHEQQQLQENLKSSQLNALLNQLNPHFIFNCINNIRALILEDASRSRDMLAHLAEMLRYNLQPSDEATETIAQELAIAHAYMQLASIQLEHRLQFELEIDKSLDQSQHIPRMLIQLLLENAIKHGISNLAQGGRVKLMLLAQGPELMIKVVNDGQLKAETDSGIGLNNIRARLAMLYAEQASFSIAQAGQEVEAIAMLPFSQPIESEALCEPS